MNTNLKNKIIPYENIDQEMRPLIYALNSIDYIYTIGCCIGHNENPVSNVFLKVYDREKWYKLMIKLLKLNNELKEANINIYQWHRLDIDEIYLVDWKINIEVHPRNKEHKEPEIERLLRIKKQAIKEIIKLIEKEVELQPLPQID